MDVLMHRYDYLSPWCFSFVFSLCLSFQFQFKINLLFIRISLLTNIGPVALKMIENLRTQFNQKLKLKSVVTIFQAKK